MAESRHWDYNAAKRIADEYAKKTALHIIKKANGVLTMIDAGVAVECVYNCPKKKNCCELK